MVIIFEIALTILLLLFTDSFLQILGVTGIGAVTNIILDILFVAALHFWIAQMAMGLISLVYNSQLGHYGDDNAISVYAVVASIMTFVIMPASGISGLRINFCVTPVLGFVMLATTFFQSIAKPIPSILITLFRQILFFIPFLYLFPVFLGINGIFIAQPVSDIIALLLSIFFVVRERRLLYHAASVITNETI